MACVAISFAIRIRAISCSVLIIRARASSGVERARKRWPRIGLVIAANEMDVARPRGALRILGRRLEADQHGLALAREDTRVVALHAPEVREIEDVVGSADDERVETLVRHERADTLELLLVVRPGHR